MSKELISDAVLLPFFWLLVFLFIAGTGFALMPYKKEKAASSNIFTCFWFGLGMSIGFLQVWNLFFPVTFYCWVCLLPIAFWGTRGLFKSGIFHIRFNKTYYRFLMALVPILIYLVSACLDNTFIYDSLVYHFYTLKWLNYSSVTPGMGNLFAYLGLNQSYFLYPAFLNSIFDNYRGACAANGLLAMVICTEIIVSNLKVLSGKEKAGVLFFFQFLFLPFCIVIGTQNLSSPTPDTFINILTFKVLSDLIRYTERKEASFRELFLLSFYCVLGSVMKLSFAGIALGVFPVLIYLLFVQGLFKRNAVLKATVLFLFLFIPWICRGIITSGYIGFPLSSFGLALDWKMPEIVLDQFADYIKGFARSHLHGAGAGRSAYGYDWLSDWIKRMLDSRGFILPVLALTFSLIILKIKKLGTGKLILILIPLFIALVFWFFTAPDIRFASFAFWSLGIAPLAYLLSRLRINRLPVFTGLIFFCAAAMMIRSRNRNLKILGDLPAIEKSVFITKSGLKINIVKNSAGTDDWRISDCTIPCSVYPDSNLVLRKNTIKEGFRIRQIK